MNLTDETLLKSKAYINGDWRDGQQGTSFAVTNPATGDVITEVSDCTAADATAAVEAAEAAQANWQAKTAKERATILRRWFDLMLQHQDDLAVIMTAEQGKPLKESKGEIAYGASFVEWFSEEAKRVYGDVIPSHQSGKQIIVLKQPIGVVGAITPWNFPNAMIARKAAPALAAGCTFVVKPAAQTPLSALAMAELGARAGIPEGVLNIVTTSKSRPVGEVFTTHPSVRKFTFTGSTEVGKQLMAQCAGTVKKVSLELGGNAPFIVFDDADLDAAVAGAMASKYRNSGQTCVCANRFLVQDGIYEAFAAKFAEVVEGLKVGNGLEGDVDQGPLIDQSALEKVESLVNEAVAGGAKVLTGGQRHDLGKTYYQPTVLTGVQSTMPLADEEIFGPVAPLFRFSTEEEAIALANATQYGLAAYFYSRDLGKVWRVAESLEYGMIGINEGIISTEVAPFGGVKESGIGREGSRYGLEEYIEIKYLLMGGLTQ